MNILPLILLSFSVVILSGCGEKPKKAHNLKLYAGAGLRRAVEKLTTEFQKETGITVETDYGGSGIILARAVQDPDADLFMPGDVWYVDRLNEKNNSVVEKSTVSYFIPTIIVQKGNPKNIKSLSDFRRKDVNVALGRADACQIGRLCDKILKKAGLERSEFNPKEALTVNELGVWVKMKDVDTAIAWDAIAANLANSIDTVAIPEKDNIISTVVIGRLKNSKNPEAAKKFTAFITGPTGKRILEENGFSTQRK